MPALRNKAHEAACQFYVLEESTKIAAWRHAYPNAKNAKAAAYQRSWELFQRPEVIERIEELQGKISDVAERKFEVDAEYVLRRIIEIDRMDIADIMDDNDKLRSVCEWPAIWRQFVSQFEVEELFAGRGDERLQTGLLKKLKWPDKVSNLKLMGSHIDVSAFKEVRELQGAGGGPIKVITTEMTAQEAAEAYADTLNN